MASCKHIRTTTPSPAGRCLASRRTYGAASHLWRMKCLSSPQARFVAGSRYTPVRFFTRQASACTHAARWPFLWVPYPAIAGAYVVKHDLKRHTQELVCSVGDMPQPGLPAPKPLPLSSPWHQAMLATMVRAFC